MPRDQVIQILVVVNGQPVHLEASLNESLKTLVDQALTKSGNSGQPAQNWVLRDSEGHELDLDRLVGEFHFKEGTKLFLSLKAGVGGCTP
jgi:hypothetical protein